VHAVTLPPSLQTERRRRRARCTIRTMDDESLNQPPPLADYNLFATDRVLREAVTREGAGWACAELEEYGCKAGTAEAIEWRAGK
jgi:hypothetical protein